MARHFWANTLVPYVAMFERPCLNNSFGVVQYWERSVGTSKATQALNSQSASWNSFQEHSCNMLEKTLNNLRFLLRCCFWFALMTVGFPAFAFKWPERLHTSGQRSVVRNSEKRKSKTAMLQNQSFTFVQCSKFSEARSCFLAIRSWWTFGWHDVGWSRGVKLKQFQSPQ